MRSRPTSKASPAGGGPRPCAGPWPERSDTAPRKSTPWRRSVFDYTREDFTRSGSRYDLVFDNAGNRSWLSMRSALSPTGTVVLVGEPRKRLLGPLGHVIRITLASKLGARKAFFLAKPGSDTSDPARPDRGPAGDACDRATLDVGQIAEVMRAMDGHASAKIVITV